MNCAHRRGDNGYLFPLMALNLVPIVRVTLGDGRLMLVRWHRIPHFLVSAQFHRDLLLAGVHIAGPWSPLLITEIPFPLVLNPRQAIT